MQTSRLIAPLLILLACGPETARAGFSFRLDPAVGVDLSNLHVGQTFTINIGLAGLGPGDQVSYLRLTEYLGGSLLRLEGIAAGNAIPSGGTFSSNGTTTSFEVGYRGFTPITAPGTLAVVTLRATRAGSGSFSLGSPTYFGPSTGDPVDYDGLARDYAIVAAAAVPEPPSLALSLVAGVMGAVAWLRRRARPEGRSSRPTAGQVADRDPD